LILSYAGDSRRFSKHHAAALVRRAYKTSLASWNFNGRHISCRVPELRNALRAAYPDWPDDQIEREIATRLVPKSEARSDQQ
jgi:hypothetical protein